MRNFIVGDLHGCYTMLEQLLDHVNFDVSCDRLFSVGDLIDRGLENEKCLALLDQSWFLAVRGNHEEMAILANEPQELTPYASGNKALMDLWKMNGGDWGGITQEQVAKLDALPVIITLENKFHVIHAEFGGDEVIHDPIVERDLQHIMQDGPSLLWERRVFMPWFARKPTEDDVFFHTYKNTLALYDIPLPETMPIYCGHTPMAQPTKIGPYINIDTYAYRHDRYDWAGLTITEPETGRFWTNFGQEIKEVTLMTL